jgi:hypothetical protein
MQTVYGIEIAPKDDRYVFIAEESVRMATRSVFPGSTLFNMFPARKFSITGFFSTIYLFISVGLLPPWFPGAGFKRYALYCKKITNEMIDRPFEFVKKNMVFVTFLPHHCSDIDIIL